MLWTLLTIISGLDPDPVILPLREYLKEEHRRLSGLPQSPPLTSAPAERLVASWWNREVRIWRIHATKSPQPFEATTELVARVAIQGEAHITSAALDRSGQLLAVSTATDIKAFELHPRLVNGKDTLRVKKITSLQDIVSTGARLVQWSPDGQWLATVSHTNEVKVVRCLWDEQGSQWKIVPKAISLSRFERPGKALPALRTNIDSYERTITRLQFSEDSRALAVADLAGYLDTWLLEGDEDTTVAELALSNQHDPSQETTTLEDSDEEDEESERITIYNQYWIQNPLGHLIPKCNGPILVLSFRPERPSERSDTTHKSHVKLFVITAKHQMMEFDVHSGRLTPWSKRNDSSQLPKRFRQLLDRAMGCVWHVTDSMTRIWVYGSNWLHMFDLDQDFQNYSDEFDGIMLPVETGASSAQTQLLGRKRRMVDTSGAGGANSANRRHKEAKVRKLENGKWENIENQPPSQAESNMEVDEDEMDIDLDVLNEGEENQVNGEEPPSGLSNEDKSRDQEGLGGVVTESEDRNGHEDGDAHDEMANPEESGYPDVIKSLVPAASSRRTPYFYTHKYRPILGVVPLDPAPMEGASGSEGVDQATPLQEVEVVLVERPIWDLDLPPRFKSDFDSNAW